MDYIEGIFTKRPFNPVSFAIRCATPVSLTTPSPASHVIILDGNTGIEANMLHGVRQVPISIATEGAVIVQRKKFYVPDKEAGIAFLRGEAARKAPYDWKGAFGLGLAPTRNWQDDSAWFCFELLCAALAKAGRPVFADNAHINAQMLLSLRY